jgi:hypothetical protein
LRIAPCTLPPPGIARTLPALLAPLAAARAQAQLDILQPPPDLPQLARPPLLESLLFENPVPLGIGVVLAALLALAIANRLGKPRRGLVVAGALLVLGVGLVGLSRIVETDREMIRARTGQVVGAVARAETGTLRELLHEEVRLTVRGLGPGWNRERILGFVDRYLVAGGRPRIDNHRVADVQVEIGPSGVTARSRARVVVESGDWNPTPVICLLTWRADPNLDGPDRWTITGIEPLWAQGAGQIDAGDLPRGF